MQCRSQVTACLSDNLSEVASMVSAAPAVYLFLDFDGTLAPIVRVPGEAKMSERTNGLLTTLTRSPRFTVIVISGRSLVDLKKRVGIESVIYAGDHGFAVEGQGLSFKEPVASSLIPELANLTGDLESSLENIPGAMVENKGLTASVHYRAVKDTQHNEVRRIVRNKVRSVPRMFHVTEGLMVLDIRPRVNWNKGAAAKLILSSSGNVDTLPIYLGDDVTDEDAFASLAAGITVRVGGSDDSLAHYQVDNQKAVEEFLTWLVQLDERLSRHLMPQQETH